MGTGPTGVEEAAAAADPDVEGVMTLRVGVAMGLVPAALPEEEKKTEDAWEAPPVGMAALLTARVLAAPPEMVKDATGIPAVAQASSYAIIDQS